MTSMSKLSNYALLILLLATAVFSYIEITAPDTFPIQKVNIVDPQQRVDRAALKQAVMPEVKKGFFQVDMQQLKQQVSLLPWVGQVVVRRVWPNKIELNIAEQKPIAQWNTGQLITPDGTIFTPRQTTMPANLPKINAAVGSQQQILASYKQLQQQLQPLHLIITQMSVSERHDITLQINHQFSISLGEHDQLVRLKRFIDIYPKVFAGKLANLESVNMQYSHGMAVHWRETT